MDRERLDIRRFGTFDYVISNACSLKEMAAFGSVVDLNGKALQSNGEDCTTTPMYGEKHCNRNLEGS